MDTSFSGLRKTSIKNFLTDSLKSLSSDGNALASKMLEDFEAYDRKKEAEYHFDLSKLGSCICLAGFDVREEDYEHGELIMKIKIGNKIYRLNGLIEEEVEESTDQIIDDEYYQLVRDNCMGLDNPFSRF